MKILLIGSGGREHAMAWKLRQDDPAVELFLAPGNAGTAQLGTNLPLGVTDLDGQKDVISGYTPAQRFFLAFGQVWCENRTEQSARVLAKTDPHSAGKWRTDGTVQNFDEFGKAFGCKVGQPMMPEKSCRVW